MAILQILHDFTWYEKEQHQQCCVANTGLHPLTISPTADPNKSIPTDEHREGDGG